jgi:hypothetical protein
MNDIERVLSDLLKPHGFTKKGKTWSCAGEETRCQVRLEKDRWRTEQSYLGFCVSVLRLKSSATGQEPTWHLFGWGYSERVEDKLELERCLNTRCESVSGLPRMALLAEICAARYVPFVLSLRTMAGIKEAYMAGRLRRCGVRTELQEFLATS